MNNSLSSTDEKFGKLKTLSEQHKVEETELTEKINIFKENEVDKKFAQFEQYSLEKRNNQIEIDVIRSNESWIGVTNPEDLDVARSALAGIKE